MSSGYVPRQGKRFGYWYADEPTGEDIENLLFAAGSRTFYNFIVIGEPKEISPQWLAKHPGGYEFYAVSYSIHHADVEDMFDSYDDPLEAFNYYLEGTGKSWVEIYSIEIVDRIDPWENTM